MLSIRRHGDDQGSQAAESVHLNNLCLDQPPLLCDVGALLSNFNDDWLLQPSPAEDLERLWCYEDPLPPPPPPRPTVIVLPARPPQPPSPSPPSPPPGLYLCNKYQLQRAFSKVIKPVLRELRTAVFPATAQRHRPRAQMLLYDQGYDCRATFDISAPYPMRLVCELAMEKKDNLETAFLDWYRVRPDNTHHMLALDGQVARTFDEAFANVCAPPRLLRFMRRNCRVKLHLIPCPFDR